MKIKNIEVNDGDIVLVKKKKHKHIGIFMETRDRIGKIFNGDFRLNQTTDYWSDNPNTFKVRDIEYIEVLKKVN